MFATSVEHTQTVAALLNREGVRSRAINGETDRSTRRRVVDEFRRGKVKALVNYGVFREGFDAPKTRAIVVARPVYSPSLYFQMIGRGLRGPLNGGDERCLILDVEDNIENFNRQLAFSELDGLWAQRVGNSLVPDHAGRCSSAKGPPPDSEDHGALVSLVFSPRVVFGP